MEKYVDNIDNLSSGIVRLSAECEVCGSDDIDIYIDIENLTITLLCSKCKAKEEICL